MKQLQTRMFSLPHGMGVDTLFKKLSKSFVVEQSEHEISQRCYYDTFDWRLHRNSLVFFSRSNSLHLERFNGKQVAMASGRRRAKFFWWDIEAGELNYRLKSLIEMRALCPIIEIQTETSQFRIMNHDRKTVARLVVRNDQLKETDSGLPEQVFVYEIRGYENEFETVVEQCRRKGCLEVKKRKLLERLLKLSGLNPRDYGDKFKVDLEEQMSVGAAVSKICLSLVDDMRTNHPGVIADIDSEFLHDFRIAVRRTRSLLSLMKKILPTEQCIYFQSEFRWLGSVTGPLRDIDVYLLEKEDYLNLLPPSLKGGMSVFFTRLEARRAGELKGLQFHLGSERYDRLLNEWCRFLSDPDSELFNSPRDQNCRVYANSTIVKRFRSFVRAGNKISDESVDQELHQLRIKGKKFRYLLEFFKSFYHEEQMTTFLKFMKKLQDNLGTFNDLSVQQNLLGSELDGLRAKNLKTIRFAAALGGLIAVLADKNRTVRGEFEATYADFTRPEVQELLESMVSATV
ncbi:MAG: CHAD domain-containing protein [Desulfofustis sp.]|nr:CHAD domain-containing protein [Desulfofustis sp.]